MENIEKIKHANELVVRHDKIDKLLNEMGRYRELRGLKYPGYSSMDKETSVDIPGFLQDKVEKAIRDCLQQCLKEELTFIDQVNIDLTVNCPPSTVN